LLAKRKDPGVFRIIHRHPHAGRLLYGLLVFWLVLAAGLFDLVDFCGNVPQEACEVSKTGVYSVFTIVGVIATVAILINLAYQTLLTKRLFKSGELIDGRIVQLSNLMPSSGIIGYRMINSPNPHSSGTFDNPVLSGTQ
jgi:hypothetical protein